MGIAWRCLCLLPTCLLAGCAGTDGQAQGAKRPVPLPSVTGMPGCFYAREVQDFTVLDRNNLIIYAPNEANAYHLRLSPRSSELRFADSIAFLPAGDRICGHAGDRLIVGPLAAAEELAIMDVARLSPGSLRALRGGTDGGAGPAAPRPRPGPGADVEGEVPPAEPGKADNGGKR
jgi:hypothetical protein